MASSGSNGFAELIAKLLKLIGLGKRSDADVLRGQIVDWKKQKQSLHDEVEVLKESIREMEGRLKAKKVELDATHGEARPIVEEEIKSLFHEVDSRTRKREVLFGGINRLNTVIGQAEQALQTNVATVSPEQVQELNLQFRSALDTLRDTDREVRRLDETNYQRTPTAVNNYEARLAALSAPSPAKATETPPTVSTAPATAEQKAPPTSSLSEAEQQRLSRLTQ